MQFTLGDEDIRQMLQELAAQDRHISQALDLVGAPASRQRPHGFTTLLNTIVSQQLSVKAAATIAERVRALMDHDPAPEKITELDDETLRAAGLSRQKVGYVRSLAEAVTSGKLDLATLHELEDEAAIDAIVQVKGLGRWSAQIYLMFALGRQDVWPVLDLGVQEGVARFLTLDARPDAKELDAIGERWRPYRSAVALLAWHYYSNAPL